MLLNRWPRPARGYMMCIWTEEFALAGHAVALLGDASLGSAFDAEDRITFFLRR